MQKITVHTGRPYDILIDDGLLEQAGDLVRRVSGAKRDLRQECIAMVRKEVTDFPLQYNNFRD